MKYHGINSCLNGLFFLQGSPGAPSIPPHVALCPGSPGFLLPELPSDPPLELGIAHCLFSWPNQRGFGALALVQLTLPITAKDTWVSCWCSWLGEASPGLGDMETPPDKAAGSAQQKRQGWHAACMCGVCRQVQRVLDTKLGTLGFPPPPCPPRAAWKTRLCLLAMAGGRMQKCSVIPAMGKQDCHRHSAPGFRGASLGISMSGL